MRLQRERGANLLRRATIEPHRLVALAFFRILVGASSIEFYISGFRHRFMFYGNDGFRKLTLFNLPETNQPSIWKLAVTPFRVSLIYVTAIVVAIAFTVVGGRTLGVLHALLLVSTYRRFPIVLNGGDNFADIAVLIAPLAVTNAYLSPLGSWVRNRLKQRPSPVRNYLHNIAVVLIVWQTCVIYFSASAWKWSSPQWRNGTALYYAMHLLQFSWMHLLVAATANPFMMRALTWGILILQTSFLPLVVTRRYAHWAAFGVIGMHAGIMLGMGLVGFGLALMGGDALCVPDSQYVSLGEKLQRLRIRPRAPTVSGAQSAAIG